MSILSEDGPTLKLHPAQSEQMTAESLHSRRCTALAMLFLRSARVVFTTLTRRAMAFRILAAPVLLFTTSILAERAAATIVRFETVMGNFDVRLFDNVMPHTVTNFLHYVTSDKYNGTVVHRNSDTTDTSGGAVRDFVIQGGGYYLTDPVPPATVMSAGSVTTVAPIADEPGGGVAGPSNVRGTIAMAKSGPNTVTSQWFINQGDNSFLDSPARSDGGFSAFGRVLGSGMTVVDAIGDLPIASDFGINISSPFTELPLRNFSGNSISQIRVQNTVTVTQVRTLDLPAGDYNFDGVVDTADYNIWKADFGSTTKAEADGNGDGRVDAADFTVWRDSLPQPLPGDYDGNGTVEIVDYNLWKADFGSTAKHEADGNGDGTVNAADYTIWRDSLGAMSAGSGAAEVAAIAAPEPTATMLFAALAASLLAARPASLIRSASRRHTV